MRGLRREIKDGCVFSALMNPERVREKFVFNHTTDYRLDNLQEDITVAETLLCCNPQQRAVGWPCEWTAG